MTHELKVKPCLHYPLLANYFDPHTDFFPHLLKFPATHIKTPILTTALLVPPDQKCWQLSSEEITTTRMLPTLMVRRNDITTCIALKICLFHYIFKLHAHLISYIFDIVNIGLGIFCLRGIIKELLVEGAVFIVHTLGERVKKGPAKLVHWL